MTEATSREMQLLAIRPTRPGEAGHHRGPAGHGGGGMSVDDEINTKPRGGADREEQMDQLRT